MQVNLSNSFIIYDLEYTAWEGSIYRNWSDDGEYKEIIEIGAIVVNKNLKEINSFNKLIIPKKNPILSDYIVKLTGITNKMILDKAVNFKNGYLEFLQFIQMYTKTAFAYGDDRIVLLENLKMNNMNDIDTNINFKNIRPYIEFQLNIGKNCIDSSALRLYLGAKKIINAHRSVDDCRSILQAINYCNKKNRK